MSTMAPEVSRTRRSATNAAVGVSAQVLTFALSFITRTVFISVLGVELLGIDQLFISILAMLAIADLGVSAALMYSLYPALAARDEVRIRALTAYAATVYRWVAGVVALLGLAVLPFLGHLVSMKDPPDQLWAYYVVLLMNTVANYLMLSRTVLLNADQRMYVTQLYAFAFSTVRSLAQIAALVVLESFFVYLALQTIFTVSNNVALYRRVGKLYPFLKAEADRLDDSSRAGIRQSVRAMMIYRLGGLVLNNSDPILISTVVGTAALGFYSNYALIVGALIMITELGFRGVFPSVGNLVAEKGGPGSRHVIYELSLLAIGVYGLVAVVLSVTLDPFIGLWLGDEFMLGQTLAVLMAINLYANGISTPVWSFRSATGMFKKTKYVLLATSGLNIVLSVILGQQYGVEGVIVATVLARLATNLWYEPYVLFRDHLGGGGLRYLANHLIAVVSLLVVGAVGVLWLPAGTGWLDVLWKGAAGALLWVGYIGGHMRATREGRAVIRRVRHYSRVG